MKYKLTAYELFALAVAAFLIDHVGLYFYSEDLWFRVFRLFALVWFVPTGYNAGRRPDYAMWQSVLGLCLLSYGLGFDVLPVVAVGTILVIRLFIDRLAEFAVQDWRIFWMVNAALLMLIPFTSKYFEYGTVAVIIALGGWLLRHKERVHKKIVDVRFYFAFMTGVYLVFTHSYFAFSAAQWAVVIVSTLATAVLMYNFKTLLLNSVYRKSADWVSRACRWIGHKSLYIYVIQIMLMQLAIAWVAFT